MLPRAAALRGSDGSPTAVEAASVPSTRGKGFSRELPGGFSPEYPWEGLQPRLCVGTVAAGPWIAAADRPTLRPMNEPGTLDPADCLAGTAMVDVDHPAVRAFAERHGSDGGADRERAIALYYAVRDGLRYDPYTIDLSERGLSASHTLELGRGWCVTKAVLLAACCRAVGIPAALGYADVRNHLSTARMRESMGTDVYIYHGYTAIWLGGTWTKATPAFNRELCEKFRIHTLEYDGRADSIYHPFDLDGRQHMEYLRYRGEAVDVPLAEMAVEFPRFYPALYGERALDEADFERDVAAETAR